MGRRRRRTNTGIPGLSFSWKRALGVTRARQRFARATGIPTTRTGLQRKVGGAATSGCGCLVLVMGFVLLLSTALGCGNSAATLAPTSLAPMLELEVATATAPPTATLTPIPTPSPTLTRTPTRLPTATPMPTATQTPLPTETPTATATPTPANTPTSTAVPATPTLPVTDACPYIGNRNSQVFHAAGCSSVRQMAEHNKVCLLSREDAVWRERRTSVSTSVPPLA